MSTLSILVAGAALLFSATAQSSDSDLKWQPLFTQEGKVTSGWKVYGVDSKLTPLDTREFWEVREGVLYGTGRFTSDYHWSSSWLISEREYGDFVLETEFKFRNNSEHGGSGIALRAPLTGDPAYNGLELQITDERFERRYYPTSTGADGLTGALYLLSAPKKQVYRSGEWNRCRIEMRGPKIKVWLNDELIQDHDLSKMTAPAKRHSGSADNVVPAPAGAKRPLKGHIGFQDDSDKGETIMFRNTRIAELN